MNTNIALAKIVRTAPFVLAAATLVVPEVTLMVTVLMAVGGAAGALVTAIDRRLAERGQMKAIEARMADEVLMLKNRIKMLETYGVPAAFTLDESADRLPQDTMVPA